VERSLTSTDSRRIITRLDALSLEEAEEAGLTEEAIAAYRFNGDIFEELTTRQAIEDGE
jgi:heme oxygenase